MELNFDDRVTYHLMSRYISNNTKSNGAIDKHNQWRNDKQKESSQETTAGWDIQVEWIFGNIFMGTIKNFRFNCN